MTAPTVDHPSGVGVLDKTSLLLGVLADGPASLRTLSDSTGLSRATVHRLALALETIRLLTRDVQGRFVLGPRISELAAESARDRLVCGAGPILAALRDRTGANARLYRRHGDLQICVAAAEARAGSPSAVGAALPLKSGASAQVLLAWEDPEELHRAMRGAGFTWDTLARVRRQGWAQSLGAGEFGCASVAVPVRGVTRRVIAAITLDGPLTHLTRTPGRRHAALLTDAATQLGSGLTI